MNHNNYFSLWQSPSWQKFQESIGRRVHMLETENISALIIQHQVPFGKCWFEIPRGPLWAEEADAADFDRFWDRLTELAKEEKAIFARINPFITLPFHSKKLRSQKAFFDHHPQTTLVINLSLSEDEILAQMKPKGRYNIKVTKKHEVEIIKSQDAAAFHELLQETTKRDGFSGHKLEYYQNMVDALGDDGLLLYAKYQDHIIAGAIFTFVGDTAVYYYGASSNQHRNVMAPYLIQWEAILEAKKRGCNNYDFLGIAPENAPNNHPWRGVTDFKKKFGGAVIEYPQAQDIIFKSVWYEGLKLKKRLG